GLCVRDPLASKTDGGLVVSASTWRPDMPRTSSTASAAESIDQLVPDPVVARECGTTLMGLCGGTETSSFASLGGNRQSKSGAETIVRGARCKRSKRRSSAAPSRSARSLPPKRGCRPGATSPGAGESAVRPGRQAAARGCVRIPRAAEPLVSSSNDEAVDVYGNISRQTRDRDAGCAAQPRSSRRSWARGVASPAGGTLLG